MCGVWWDGARLGEEEKKDERNVAQTRVCPVQGDGNDTMAARERCGRLSRAWL